MQQANIPQRDLDGSKRAKIQLEGLYLEHGLDGNGMHNICQKTTWDASADAKAARASIGQMPAHIEERVDKACGVIAEAVKRKGRKDGRCLDVGCGHGALIPNFIKAGMYPNQITGVDLSTEMIRNAQESYRGVDFVAADFLEFSPEEGYDGIILCSALHDLPDMYGSLANAASLLRDDGKLVLVHAQGAMHVVGQNKANPVLVKRALFNSKELKVIAEELNLVLDHEPAEAGSEVDEKEGYLAILTKVD